MGIQQQISLLYDKKREIETEIAGLKVREETERRRFREAAAAADGLDERVKDLEEQVVAVQKLSDEAVTVCHQLINQTTETMQESERMIEASEQILIALQAEITVQELVLKGFERREKERLAHVAKETERLDTMRVDLHLYKERLQEKYYELGLGKLNL